MSRASTHEEKLAWLIQVLANPTDECVEWPFLGVIDGYGRLVFMGRMMNASRAALILATGKDPVDLMAAHGSCHNRLCVNPGHLSWETALQNQQDRERDSTLTKKGWRHQRFNRAIGSSKEKALLNYLRFYRGQVVSMDEIDRVFWNERAVTKAAKSYVIRKINESSDIGNDIVVTVHGYGLMLLDRTINFKASNLCDPAETFLQELTA